jgi:hypothetical protein
VLTGMVLGDLLAPWGMQAAGGQMTLRVGTAELSPRGIDHLVASGKCEGISLRALSEPSGAGRMSGTARMVISDLTIQDNHLASLDAGFRVAQGPEPKWIEGRLITNLLSRVLNVELPAILPERIEYTQLGVRLEVRDEILYVFGTHGTRGKTILTARVMDHEIPLVWEPEQGRDLAGWFDELRTRATAYLQPWRSVSPRQAWQVFSALRRGERAPAADTLPSASSTQASSASTSSPAPASAPVGKP